MLDRMPGIRRSSIATVLDDARPPLPLVALALLVSDSPVVDRMPRPLRRSTQDFDRDPAEDDADHEGR